MKSYETEEAIVCGIKCIGYAIKVKLGNNPCEVQPGFENDVFALNPYCWCE